MISFPLSDGRTLEVSSQALSLCAAGDCHFSHGYFNYCPESPAGDTVVGFHSTDPEGHLGRVALVPTGGGEPEYLTPELECEDAHRQAYQQWVLGGKGIVYQHYDARGDTWEIHYLDLATREDRVIATGYQLGWGNSGDWVPIHPLHWDPQGRYDLEALEVPSGKRRTLVTAEELVATYPDWWAERYEKKPISIFFGVLSPDGKRIFFKVAHPLPGEGFRRVASKRHGFFVRDLEAGKFLYTRPNWGHPAWSRDGRYIVTPQNVIIDLEELTETKYAGVPDWPGSHPAFQGTGLVYVSDTYLKNFGGGEREWGIGLVDPVSQENRIIFRSGAVGGAKSWRVPHPHPVFNREGTRLYFNVDDGNWTRLHSLAFKLEG